MILTKYPIKLHLVTLGRVLLQVSSKYIVCGDNGNCRGSRRAKCSFQGICQSVAIWNYLTILSFSRRSADSWTVVNVCINPSSIFKTCWDWHETLTTPQIQLDRTLCGVILWKMYKSCFSIIILLPFLHKTPFTIRSHLLMLNCECVNKTNIIWQLDYFST